MFKNYEDQYIQICKDILDNGYYSQNRTGTPTYKLPHQIIRVDLEKELPILKTKQVFFKSAVDEILWIMQKQSNNVKDLNSKIWDSWSSEDGSIGKAYGYQVKKYKQIDKLIYSLNNNPQDRRMIINLWNVEDLEEMNLQPCCLMSIWDVTDDKLNCMLIQRSADVPVGLPFNTLQYSVLNHMLSQVTGLKPGILTHVISNAHIYENQIPGIEEQIDRYEKLKKLRTKVILEKAFTKKTEYTPEELKLIPMIKTKPKLKLNPDIKDFYDFTMDDIKLESYNHMGKIEFPVSV